MTNNQLSRDLNSAAISIHNGCIKFVEKNDFDLCSGDCDPTHYLSIPPGISLFFSPNATQCMLNIVEYFVFRRGWGIDFGGNSRNIHPVVMGTLGYINNTCDSGVIHLKTLMHWITGEFFSNFLAPETSLRENEFNIIDAVHAFGNFNSNEISAVFELVNSGNVVVGCLQKWLGCPVPLGFALVPTRLMEKYPDLRDHLAARDYLGTSIGVRAGYDSFPDTYSASLAPIFIQPLRVALGNDVKEMERVRCLIEANRQFIREAVGKSGILHLVITKLECRSIVAASASSEDVNKISHTLQKNCFTHSVYQDYPSSGICTMRFSSPLVEMDTESRRLFQSILSGQS